MASQRNYENERQKLVVMLNEDRVSFILEFKAFWITTTGMMELLESVVKVDWSLETEKPI
jgi:hypothetical protein